MQSAIGYRIRGLTRPTRRIETRNNPATTCRDPLMGKRLLLVLFCGGGLLLAAPRPALSGDNDNVLADELTVKAAGLPVDGAGLLEFLRVRTRGEVAAD